MSAYRFQCSKVQIEADLREWWDLFIATNFLWLQNSKKKINMNEI